MISHTIQTLEKLFLYCCSWVFFLSDTTTHHHYTQKAQKNVEQDVFRAHSLLLLRGVLSTENRVELDRKEKRKKAENGRSRKERKQHTVDNYVTCSKFSKGGTNELAD